MPLHRDRAICLRKHEYSETSQILTLFGRQHGIVRVIAKGAHRRTKVGASKFDGGIDLLDLGECLYIDRAKDLSTLTEWKLLNGYLGLRRSLRGILLGQSIAEVITLLFAEHDPYPEAFDRLRITLPRLAADQGQEHFLALLIDMIEFAGFLPEQFEDIPADSSPGHAPTRNRTEHGFWRIADTIRKLPREKGLPIRLPKLTRKQTDPLLGRLFDHVSETTQRAVHTRAFVMSQTGTT